MEVRYFCNDSGLFEYCRVWHESARGRGCTKNPPQWIPEALVLEPEFPEDVTRTLQQRGHTLKRMRAYSSVQVTMHTDLGIMAGADPRKGGTPIDTIPGRGVLGNRAVYFVKRVNQYVLLAYNSTDLGHSQRSYTRGEMSALSTFHPCTTPYRNPPAYASPAPVVSMALVSTAGIVTRESLCRIKEPFDPSLTTMVSVPARCHEFQ